MANAVNRSRLRDRLAGRRLAYCQRWYDAMGDLVAYTLHASKYAWRYIMGAPDKTGAVDKNFWIKSDMLARRGLSEVGDGQAFPNGRPYVCAVSETIRAQLDERMEQDDDESRYVVVIRDESVPEVFYPFEDSTHEYLRKERIRKRLGRKLSPEQKRALDW